MSSRIEVSVSENHLETTGVGGRPIQAKGDFAATLERLTLLSRVFSHSQEAVMFTDSQNRIVEVNPAFTRITGYEASEVIGKDPKILSSGRQSSEFYAELWQSLQAEGQWQGEIWNRHKDGHIYAEILSITKLFDESGQLTHYLAMFLDISRLKAHEEELRQIAHYDVLTGIPNRRLLQDRMRQDLARARRSERQLAVCYLDLDGFKPINDKYGHAIGDLVLIEITQRIQATMREVDTLARLGGDEFVLLITELSDTDEIDKILERVLRTVSAPILIEGKEMGVTASIGVTLFPKHGIDPDTLLRCADQAMYQAKRDGRNRYVFFHPAEAVDEKAIVR